MKFPKKDYPKKDYPTMGKLIRASMLLCSYIQEVYPEEYKKYSEELEPWVKSKGLKL